MSVSVRPVLSKQDKKLFLDVPFALYGKGSNWVAPLYFERFEHLDPKKNPQPDSNTPTLSSNAQTLLRHRHTQSPSL